jgi:hypothetical protein
MNQRDTAPRLTRGVHHTNVVIICIKLVTKPVMMNLLSRTQGKAYCANTTGEDSRVTTASAGLGPRTIQGANLRPELPNDILSALKRYGAIRGIIDDAW